MNNGTSLIDAQFLDYRVQGKIGEGGTSEVFCAYSRTLDRQDAIKMLSERHEEDADSRERLLREARAASAICHPNVVRVFACGTDPRPYVIMELLHGETLRQRLVRAGRLPTPMMLALSRQMVAALRATSACGFVHRDLKPENFFLAVEPGESDLVKLLDFGTVKIAGEMHTQAGTLLGTPAYMSPEQCEGEAQAIEISSDVYSLGIVFYEMLTGEPPFREVDPKRLRLLHRKASPDLDLLKDQPQPLRALIARMLRKVPNDRPALHEIAGVLERLSTPWKRTAAIFAWTALVLVAASVIVSHTFRRSVLVAGASELRQVAGGHLRMGRTPEERQRQYDPRRPKLLQKLLDDRQPVREVDVAPFLLEATEVTWEQAVNWLNSLWLVRIQAEEHGPMRNRYITDWKGRKLFDLDTNEGCGIERDGFFGVRVRPGCNGMQPAEAMLPAAAAAYCEALGRHLVTEEQWEQAARGETNRLYPWGDSPPICAQAVFGQASTTIPGFDPDCPREQPHAADVRDPTGDMTPDAGIKHLFGNVSEITSTPYIDRKDPDTLKHRYYVVRGTNFGGLREQGYTSYRSRIPADTPRARCGFRCAQ